MEILLLSGGTPYANFRALAHAWGRERGFHNLLANSICERRGDIERKRRSDAGRTLTSEQKESFKQKLRKTRQFKTDRKEGDSDDESMGEEEDEEGDGGGVGTEDVPTDLLNAPSVEEMVESEGPAVQCV